MQMNDLKDCLNNDTIPIKFFDQCHDQMWKIKGKVSLVEFSETTNLQNGDIDQGIEVHMEHSSGEKNYTCI